MHDTDKEPEVEPGASLASLADPKMLGGGDKHLSRKALIRKAGLWRRLAWLAAGVAAVSLTANVLMFFRYTPARPLVTVGSTVIHSRDYQTQLDAAAGRPVLTRMVFSELVKQAGAKAGVTPTAAQIDARITELQRQGALQENVTEEAREGLALDMTLESLRTAGVTASDAEIADFYRRNAARLGRPAQSRSILVLTDSDLLADNAAGLLRQGKSEAEIAAQPGMQVDGEQGFRLNIAAMPSPLQKKVTGVVMALQPGQMTTLPLGTNFLTIKCLSRLPRVLPPLSQIQDEVARLVKLQKAPSASEEMVRLYQANRPDFDIDRYAAYFTDIDNAAPGKTASPAIHKTASAR
jgi:hypothetical protein